MYKYIKIYHFLDKIRIKNNLDFNDTVIMNDLIVNDSVI